MADVGDDIGDFTVLQIGVRRHDILEFLAIHLDRALEATKNDAGRNRRVARDPTGTIKRRECAGNSFTIRAVAGNAGAAVNSKATLVNRWIRLIFTHDIHRYRRSSAERGNEVFRKVISPCGELGGKSGAEFRAALGGEMLSRSCNACTDIAGADFMKVEVVKPSRPGAAAVSADEAVHKDFRLATGVELVADSRPIASAADGIRRAEAVNVEHGASSAAVFKLFRPDHPAEAVAGAWLHGDAHARAGVCNEGSVDFQSIASVFTAGNDAHIDGARALDTVGTQRPFPEIRTRKIRVGNQVDWRGHLGGYG